MKDTFWDNIQVVDIDTEEADQWCEIVNRTRKTPLTYSEFKNDIAKICEELNSNFGCQNAYIDIPFTFKFTWAAYTIFYRNRKVYSYKEPDFVWETINNRLRQKQPEFTYPTRFEIKAGVIKGFETAIADIRLETRQRVKVFQDGLEKIK